MYFVILGQDMMFSEKWQRSLLRYLPTRRYRRYHLQFGFFRSLDRGVVRYYLRYADGVFLLIINGGSKVCRYSTPPSIEKRTG